jgi:phosphatidylserine decarboxylase
MAETLETWVDLNLPLLEKKSIKELSHEFFFRDPPRPLFVDNEYFFSPADGIILYQKFIKDPTEPVVEIKGNNYTLQHVIGDDSYNSPSLVIGIFMTFLDVHINRIPYGGMLSYRTLEPIESINYPMLAVEKDILNKVINPNNMGYLTKNERVINEIYVPKLDYTYYVAQIADDDVNVIAPFKKQGDICLQNERFSLIRWGSQNDLVLPLDNRFNFKIMQDDHVHVEAGIDPLVKLFIK